MEVVVVIVVNIVTIWFVSDFLFYISGGSCVVSLTLSERYG
jgi:hypothetical protein